MIYDYVVVGAGLAGGILARQLAENHNKKVLIIERRTHIAGNTFDYDDKRGVKVQKYGPHVFHTNLEEVYNFITRFCTPITYKTKCEAEIDGISTPSPFNFKTIDQFYSKDKAIELKKKLLDYYNNQASITVVEMLEADDDDIRGFAEFLFEKDYKLYTAKQWNLSPEEIDPSVLKRVPIVLSYGDTYFYDKYEFMPQDGFEKMYQRLIDHPNITVKLNMDALNYLVVDEKKKVINFNNEVVKIIYTGAIDELFGYKFGTLPYRSLYFDFKNVRADSFQKVAIVAYPQADGYTRVTEYTKMPYQSANGWTSIAYEYPVPYNKNAEKGSEPYYPVLTEESQKIYKKYSDYAKQFSNLVLCGRLADFKYYNMDQVISRVLELYKNMEVD